MKIRILFFAALREKMNRAEGTYEFEGGETPSDMALRLFGSDRSLLFAVNDELVEKDYQLQDGDCLAFIPPMAGG
jgi:molybdopterin converting factor small subunit